MNISWQQIWRKNSNTGTLNSVLKVVEENALPFQKKTSLHLLSEQRGADTSYLCLSQQDRSLKCTVGNLGSMANG